MEVAQHKTLLLSQGFEPVKVIPWQRAITLLFLGKVEVVESYDRDIKTTSLVIKIPAVVRLLNAFKRFRKPVKFSRISVYARDQYCCQYCGEEKRIADLTYDHVLPRSQGGLTEWTNIVASCYLCNKKKGGRTPEQAGMKLRKQPVQPKTIPALVVQLNRESVPDAWRDFVYWTEELEP
jgi:5-methylcytosine-specific restriction endonuclease McrA